MRRLLLMGIGVLIIASAGGMGSKLAKDWSRLKETEQGIREQEAMAQKVREAKKKLHEEVERARAELQAVPDSLRAGGMGRVMQKSMFVAKEEEILERDVVRVKSRLRHLKGQRESVLRNLSRWGVALALTEALLIGGAVIVGRYARRVR